MLELHPGPRKPGPLGQALTLPLTQQVSLESLSAALLSGVLVPGIPARQPGDWEGPHAQASRLHSWLFWTMEYTRCLQPHPTFFQTFPDPDFWITWEHFRGSFTCLRSLSTILLFLILFFLFAGTKKRSHGSPAPSTSSTSRLTLPGG